MVSTYIDGYKHDLCYSYDPQQVGIEPKPFPVVVLIGEIGSGKTSLYNKITNSNEKVEEGGGSVTKNVFKILSHFGTSKFYILDSPGSNSESERLAHCEAIVFALTLQPVNSICILTKFDKNQKMVDNLETQIDMIPQIYNEYITIVVTHFDKNPHYKQQLKYQEAKHFIQQYFQGYNFDKFIFVGKDSSPDYLCETMYNISSSTPRKQIEITQKEFELNFNYLQNTKTSMRKNFKQISDNLDEFQKNIEQDLLQTKNVAERDEICNQLLNSIPQIFKQILEEFMKNFCEDLVGVDRYSCYMSLVRKINKRHNEFSKMLTTFLSQSLPFLVTESDNSNPRNFIKQCPHCNLIWIKITGCDGETTCGNLPKMLDQFGINIWNAIYQFNFVKGKLCWSKNALQTKEKVQLKGEQFQSKREIKIQGCKQKFTWKDEPQLSEARLNELFADNPEIYKFLLEEAQNYNQYDFRKQREMNHQITKSTFKEYK